MGRDHTAGDDRRLAGRRAVITGAARGIGAAIARSYVEHGASVALLDRDDAVHSVASDLGGWSEVVDLADPAEARRATAAAVDALGGIDVLVNNAGILRFADLLDITVEDWDETFAVNTRAMLLTMQVAVRSMIAAGHGGTIVNMASMGGKVGAPGRRTTLRRKRPSSR
ncbi:MAG: SDR family NAD(P)-dependent oxidoreductase [Ilumatobacteraceae bacterium]